MRAGGWDAPEVSNDTILHMGPAGRAGWRECALVGLGDFSYSPGP